MKTIINITYSAFALFALACFALAPQARAVCQKGCFTSENTVLGEDALLNNTSGQSDTAIGFGALQNNMGTLFTGSFNTATGANALIENTIGNDNTATGSGALESNQTGSLNTANGADALFNNTGGANTAIGFEALFLNTTGSGNIALGDYAGVNLSTGDNNIDIGNQGVIGESNTIRIGTGGTQTVTFIAGIFGVPITGGVPIGINSSGQLGVRPSSVRFKELIEPMDRASEAILALKPVTFHYKKELDPKGALQFGLVAEEVAKVNPNLVATDEQGKPFTVRYEAVNAMLLNEFLKEHKTVQEQGARIAQQQKQIEALTAGLQKVSAQLELSKTAPRTVGNNQ